MPELPEVECVRLGLMDLIGHTVQSASTNYPKLWEENSQELNELLGQELLDVKRKGKYLVLEFEQSHF